MNDNQLVTELKEAMADQTAISELFEYLPEVIFFVKDLKFRLLMVNDACVRLLKASGKKDVIGKSGFDYYPKLRADAFHEDDKIVYDEGKPLLNRLELILDEEGVMSWFSTNKLPIFGKDGSVIGLMGTTQNMGEAEVLSQFPANISLVLDYITENFRSAVTIEELAEMSHLSVSQFRRNFKKIFKMSPLQFILQLRIQATCNLLRSSDDSIWAVAEECGFNDQSYFSKKFRQHIGISPGKYRQNYGY